MQLDEIPNPVEENTKNLALSTFNPEFTAAYLLQQQQQQQQQQQEQKTTTFYTGNNSHRSQGSNNSTFGRPYNTAKVTSSRGSQSPIILPTFVNHTNYEPFNNNENSSAESSAIMRTREQQQQVLQDIKNLCWQQAANAVEQRRRMSEGKAEQPSQSEMIGGRISPRSSTFGDSEGSDCECEDESTSSCSSRLAAYSQGIPGIQGAFFVSDRGLGGWGEAHLNTSDNSAFDSGVQGLSSAKIRKPKPGATNPITGSGRNSFSIAMSSPLI